MIPENNAKPRNRGVFVYYSPKQTTFTGRGLCMMNQKDSRYFAEQNDLDELWDFAGNLLPREK